MNQADIETYENASDLCKMMGGTQVSAVVAGLLGVIGRLAESRREHIDSHLCWCQPQLSDDFTDEGGAKHYVHRDIQ